MIETIQNVNHLLGIAGIIGIFFIAFLIFDIAKGRVISSLVSRWGMKLALVATVGSIALTLLYSDVFGIVPCGLCWFERIALYPQVLLLATAIYYKDMYMPRYGIVLSIFGLIISLYHHYIQMGGSEFIKCPASGAADCAKRFIFEFNFITFPLLAAILFTFLITLYIYILKTQEQRLS